MTTNPLTVLRAAWLFDGTGDTLTPDPAVVLDGGKIVAIGSEVPEGATVVDLGEATILPGLVDTHVHLAFDASPDPVAGLAGRDDAEAFAAMAAAARAAARGGVTTVRDLGDRGYLSLGLRDAAVSDTSLPTIVAAGPPITSPGGHCHFLGEEAADTAGIRAAIRAHAARGVDVIKIMASGGNMTPGSKPEAPQFGLDELRVAVHEAHRNNLPITAHAHGTQAIIDAVEAGVDGLEHISFMTEDGVDEIPPGLLETLAERQIALGATLGFVPVPGIEVPAAIATRMRAFQENTRKLYEAGTLMVAGTDAGIAPVKPHDVLRWAIPALIGVGMSPAEALRATTSRAAAVCGLGDRKGRVAPGYDADILAIDGDPLRDPGALHRIRAVYLRGAAVERVSALV
ncbi:amidohydrolase family protein [Amycolatopsis sp. NPDC059657]|uniref:amidohydrolase family protein n=1 Tax=Amycolatopsis sp. NPDC059657 TaxID=3346899 RepID=UPI003672C98F